LSEAMVPKSLASPAAALGFASATFASGSKNARPQRDSR
jgi:hypothetical protein